jgi:hypothetical protein
VNSVIWRREKKEVLCIWVAGVDLGGGRNKECVKIRWAGGVFL